MQSRRSIGLCCLPLALTPACSLLPREPSPFDQPAGRTAPVNPEIQFEALSGVELARAQRPVLLATSLYPPSFLPKLGATTEPVRDLRLRGEKVAGTTDFKRVLVNWSSSGDPAFDDIQAFATVHHELAHVALDRFRATFPTTEWVKALPPKFEYRIDSDKPRTTDAADVMADWELRNVRLGFLLEESKDSVDEDFASIAEELFRNDELFWYATTISPRLKAKVDLAIGFYTSIEPAMNKEWFQSLSRPLGEHKRSMSLFTFP